jgi:rod shape-determining protein MreC
MRSLYFAFLRNKHHIAFIFALSISLKILLSDASPGLDLIRKQANDVFSFLYTPVTWVKSLLYVNRENELLRQKNLQLSLQVAAMLNLEAENRRLQELLDFKRTSTLTFIPAQVTGMGMAPNLTSISIDIGSNAGITPNTPVITPEGVVGKVVLVGKHSAIVQLLSDLNYRLSVRILPSGATGILRWKGNGVCEVREVPKNVEIHVGDRVVTSGFSDIYPAGLPVGEVTGVLEERGSFQKIVSVKIFSNLSSLMYVFVITQAADEMG